MNLTVYLSPQEIEYVRSRGPGFVRSLVRAEMTGPAPDDPDAPEKSSPADAHVSEAGAQVARRVRGARSACCGSLILAGKCQICGAKARAAG